MRRTLGRAALVGGGYLAAAGAASVAMGLRLAATAGPDRNASGGMYAFGDALFFLFALAFLSIPATGLALYFLRPVRGFWKAAAVVAALLALTGLGAMGAFFAGRGLTHGILGTLASVSVLRVLIAPPLGILWAVLAVFAPEKEFRRAFAGALLLELAGFAPVALYWALGMARFR